MSHMGEDSAPTLVLLALRGIDTNSVARALNNNEQCDEVKVHVTRLQAAVEARRRDLMPEDEKNSLTFLLETKRIEENDTESNGCCGCGTDVTMRRVGYLALGGIKIRIAIDLFHNEDHNEGTREGSVSMVFSRCESAAPAACNESEIKQDKVIWSFDFRPYTTSDSTIIFSHLDLKEASNLLTDSGVTTWEDRVSDEKPVEEKAREKYDWEIEEEEEQEGPQPFPFPPHPILDPAEKRIRSFAANLVLSLLEIMSTEPTQNDLWSESVPPFSYPGAEAIFALAQKMDKSCIPCPSFNQLCSHIKLKRNYELSRYEWMEEGERDENDYNDREFD